MQRLREERGAIAVIVAILMVALIGFVAIAVDVAAMWSEKRQLQNGADAGALAIAQACAKNACGSPSATAQSFATLNKNDGSATGTVVSLTGSQVTVRASDPHENWFARIFGSDQTAV
ncbi:MAG TPA: pilus assembly protein TadG-related protein, partial [Microlunatus sp.]|nr:pilus assembly protein TadG-related protein [Microlunatus sp.]